MANNKEHYLQKLPADKFVDYNGSNQVMLFHVFYNHTEMTIEKRKRKKNVI